jgi:hypothetical protein
MVNSHDVFDFPTDGRPSQITDVPFIHVYAESPPPLPAGMVSRLLQGESVRIRSSGKWLLFVDRKNVDDVWVNIATAVKAGRLGPQAKVATAMPSSYGRPGKHVINVYTIDADDREDVMRVRAELRALGFKAKIAYKSDETTREGRYEGTGRVSKYFE